MKKPRRIGILGGTFDPIHRGHTDLGAAADNALELSRVIVIPANVPHYGWVKSGESTQQDCGWGPTGSTPVATSAAR